MADPNDVEDPGPEAPRPEPKDARLAKIRVPKVPSGGASGQGSSNCSSHCEPPARDSIETLTSPGTTYA
jgi:hypothetical protein